MFCPGCGLEETNFNQYCRACGTDLRPVRFALEKPDAVTASAATARDEIGRAVAFKIREAQDAQELAVVAENVLPEVEKFLESPEEKRLRRMRTGTTIASVGIGVAIALSIVAVFARANEPLFLAALGLITFFIGLGFLLNGFFLTVPKKSISDKSIDADVQRELDANTSELVLPESNQIFSSVTEQTTRHLKEKQPAPRK